jgi:hypothetical protein
MMLASSIQRLADPVSFSMLHETVSGASAHD